jgi:L-ribulose-5-phosphate 3-epimerase
MKYGLMSSSMPGPYPDVIRNSGKLGFDGVELDIGADYEQNMLWDEGGRAEIERLLTEAGVELASLCLGTFWTYSFANPDAAVRARAQGFTADAIQWCAALGGKLILVPITTGAEVCLAAENVGRGSGQTAEALLEIADGVASPAVQVYYDFGNGLSLGGDPVAEIEALGRRIVQVHAKDPRGEYMGEGRVDMAAVKKALDGIGYDSYLVLETPPTDDPVAAAARNLKFLREHF